MMAQTFGAAVNAFLSRSPFRPFVIELNTGTRLTVIHPEAISLRGLFAVYNDPVTFLRQVFDATSVLRICELPRANPPPQ